MDDVTKEELKDQIRQLEDYAERLTCKVISQETQIEKAKELRKTVLYLDVAIFAIVTITLIIKLLQCVVIVYL